jgi:MraZ protein
MIGILGEYEATLDAKGRFLLPVGFKKQLPEEDTTRFVMNRGMDGCLTLFTIKSWEPFYAKMNALDELDEDERPVKRFFLGGPTYVEPDSAGRLLVPAHLKAYAGLQKDLVLHWAGDKLEIWDSNKYNEFFDSITPKTLSTMVHKVFGKKTGGND